MRAPRLFPKLAPLCLGCFLSHEPSERRTAYTHRENGRAFVKVFMNLRLMIQRQKEHMAPILRNILLTPLPQVVRVMRCGRKQFGGNSFQREEHQSGVGPKSLTIA